MPRRLEELRRQGRRADVHQFLVDLGDVTVTDLVAVLGIDQWQRWHVGERIPPEAYLDHYPVLADDPQLASEVFV
jgi:hypothetical protein